MAVSTHTQQEQVYQTQSSLVKLEKVQIRTNKRKPYFALSSEVLCKSLLRNRALNNMDGPRDYHTK